ncbi:hypothetical protein BaRGS_00028786 [Batillaria attramentaria]|uniref:Uncharacterized protein n=1 Tax=Batillaria attramentaria TaxID=370345 RepID=A0ABD0JY90_9CAEN
MQTQSKVTKAGVEFHLYKSSEFNLNFIHQRSPISTKRECKNDCSRGLHACFGLAIHDLWKLEHFNAVGTVDFFPHNNNFWVHWNNLTDWSRCSPIASSTPPQR